MPPEFELCAETIEACIAARDGGADRIELCSALDVDGVTPSYGLIAAAIEAAHPVPVHVLLRPRAGDFVYSNAEFRVMCADMEASARLGAAGFAAGILTRQSEVDIARMAMLVQKAAGKKVTFHRAIDECADSNRALEDVIETGCGRILTSNAARFAKLGAGRIRIAAAGGIRAGNVAALRSAADVDIHSSLRSGAPISALAVERIIRAMQI